MKQYTAEVHAIRKFFTVYYLGKHVAIKVRNLDELSTNEKDIDEEYRVLRDLSSHPNIPDFYGAFKNDCELWFAMEVRRVMFKNNV